MNIEDIIADGKYAETIGDYDTAESCRALVRDIQEDSE